MVFLADFLNDARPLKIRSIVSFILAFIGRVQALGAVLIVCIKCIRHIQHVNKLRAAFERLCLCDCK